METHLMDPIIIPIVAILMPVVLVPIILILKHRHRRREMEHLERMKALESRMPFAPGTSSPALKGVAAIGAGVPIAAVFAALLTTTALSDGARDPVAVAAVNWGCAALISAAAFITSLLLALMHARAAHHADEASAMNNAKPIYDPDTFDVVSSRA
jgi:hypothetical protein